MLKFFAYALKFSAALNGYDAIPPPSQYPPIVVAGESTIVDKCLGDALACYDMEENKLYLHKDICSTLSLRCKATIVHEATHVLQRANGRSTKTGYCVGDLEKQAYATEDNWLRAKGTSSANLFGYTESAIAPYTTCSFF